MTKYIFIFHGDHTPDNPADMEKVMAAWGAWFGGMGDALVSGGSPVRNAKTVLAEAVSDGGGANPASGYTLVNAKDMAAAIAMAKGCPILADGGSIEVGECFDI